jgi:hypothetical protein
MPKAPSKRRLKVFAAQFGFYDTVVAAPSQAAALRAWGIHQNIFASGQAKVTDDPQAVEAALAHPEIPLKRAVGSKDPFALEAARLPDVPDAPKKPKLKAVVRPKPEAVVPPRPAADRTELDKAEAKLHAIDEARKREEAEFRRREEELVRARDAAQAAYVQNRKVATAEVVKARSAYRDAGGAD